MTALDRYVSATRSSNLSVDERTTMSDSDMLGAMGYVAMDPKMALSATLVRLYAGDHKTAAAAVTRLADDLGRHRPARELSRLQCEDLARAVLAWHKDGTCRACGGHGHLAMPGAPVLSGHECGACRGTGKIRFEENFRERQIPLARWLLNRVESNVSGAGQALNWRLR